MANLDVIIRPCEPNDEPQCRALFRNGMLDLLSAYYSIEVKGYLRIMLLLLPLLVALTWSLRVVAAVVIVFTVFAAILYIIVYFALMSFINECLNSDLQDISKSYQHESSMFVAILKDKVVGMAAVAHREHHKPGVAELLRMSVDSSIRKRGIASKLLKTIFEFCRENNYSNLTLGTTNAQVAAMGLYEKYGFKEMYRVKATIVTPFIKAVYYEKHID